GVAGSCACTAWRLLPGPRCPTPGERRQSGHRRPRSELQRLPAPAAEPPLGVRPPAAVHRHGHERGGARVRPAHGCAAHRCHRAGHHHHHQCKGPGPHHQSGNGGGHWCLRDRLCALRPAGSQRHTGKPPREPGRRAHHRAAAGPCRGALRHPRRHVQAPDECVRLHPGCRGPLWVRGSPHPDHRQAPAGSQRAVPAECAVVHRRGPPRSGGTGVLVRPKRLLHRSAGPGDRRADGDRPHRGHCHRHCDPRGTASGCPRRDGHCHGNCGLPCYRWGNRPVQAPPRGHEAQEGRAEGRGPGGTL
ncbi:Integral membrane protein, partial [Arthrobacter sp. DR-2P]